MSLQRMALFDAVVDPNAHVYHMSHRSVDKPTDYEIDAFKQARRVWVDESLHQRVEFIPAQVDFAKDFGELRLPYPHLWIEWINTRRRSSRIVAKADSLHMALQCFETTGQKDGERSWLGVPWMFMPDSNQHGFSGYATEYDQIFRIDFDESGQTLGVSGYQRLGDSVEPIPMVTEETRNTNDLSALIDLCWNGLIAIGFMNCKNVTTERHERMSVMGPKVKRKRAKLPRLEYHTIVLPSVHAAGSGGSGPKQDILPMHQVRGHFKTYTTEAPLMGKHTGTYWWGWQVRGNKKNGIVVSDYKVGA